MNEQRKTSVMIEWKDWQRALLLFFSFKQKMNASRAQSSTYGTPLSTIFALNAKQFFNILYNLFATNEMYFAVLLSKVAVCDGIPFVFIFHAFCLHLMRWIIIFCISTLRQMNFNRWIRAKNGENERLQNMTVMFRMMRQTQREWEEKNKPHLHT